MNRQYWQFYWPLSLTGVFMLAGRHFQNGTLARYPDAARELAVFAYATSVFFLFNAALVFVPQMANVLGTSRASRRVCLRFTALIGLVLSAPLAVVAFTPPGDWILKWFFELKGDTLAQVKQYLVYLTPMIPINGLRQYFSGLLVQSRRTGIHTALNVVTAVLMAGLLVTGYARKWNAVTTVALAQVVAVSVHLVLTYVCWRVVYRSPGKDGSAPLTYREAWSFFWPVAVTSSMFSLSRPIIYSFASRQPDSETVVAALRVGFDFAMLFHVPLNQFRHLLVTFGKKDLAGVRRFMICVTLAMLAIMVLLVSTPLVSLFLEHLIGVRSEILQMSREAIWALCLIPPAVTLRNYFHGVAMIDRETWGMGLGGVMRNVAIYLACWAFLALGRLNHVLAGFTLVLGFVVEALVVFAAMKWAPHRKRQRPPRRREEHEEVHDSEPSAV